MRKQKKTVTVLTGLIFFIAISVYLTRPVMAGSLEPTGVPGSTMKTLDEIPPTWSQRITPASKRFEKVLYDYAVLDKETGLVWAKDANYLAEGKTWEDAVRFCRNMLIGNRKGWRLPTVEELASLVDPLGSSPDLPAGYSSFFENVQSSQYWTATTDESDTGRAYIVNFSTGDVGYSDKSNIFYVWPVRGGSGPILVPHTPAP